MNTTKVFIAGNLGHKWKLFIYDSNIKTLDN